ncbi:acyltransferase family protein [Streptomyces sp. CMB-StM0423]|uniref:acyltransferase family protein n=1 Tax=Streptomyces sp. CMB-StM0423 TaxID=2059884 RepID=UPI000C70D404|nr:acyltransferase family protein [Streptomyces sp. CMB-StM0423]AUH42798.1 acyltransferase [Streptomyces sp. CMB-StM0423]
MRIEREQQEAARDDERDERRRPAFRPDVEGLRAVALGLVLLYHAGVPWFPGGYVGVDVFFVVSGFLITGLLLREAERHGKVSLLRFYGRRARRLLPAAAVVVLAVCLAAVQWMPPLERRNVAADAVGAALYATNWQQAGRAVDYSAADAEASPLQHYWSLAVEEQFYLAWPLLVLAVLWTFRKVRGGGKKPVRAGDTGRAPLPARFGLRARLAVVLGALAAVSFAHAVRLSAEEGGVAYFSTFTRGWELAVGGLLALVPAAAWRRALPAAGTGAGPGARTGALAAGALAAAGLAAVAYAGLRFDDATRFPGPWGLLPVLGTAAVIAAGCGPAAHPVARLLSVPPLRYAGRISYSWYLWHWPAVVFVPLALDRELSVRWMLVVVAAAALPAALTHRLVEEPVRRARVLLPTPRALAVGAACTTATVLVAAGSWISAPTIALASAEQARGAAALADEDQPQKSAKALRPLPEKATDDRGKVHDDGCLAGQQETESGDCAYGNKGGSDTVVLFGDSHAMQYSPALEKITERRGLRLVTLTKSACTPAQVTVFNNQLQRTYTECDEWRDNALDRIEEEDPDLIITGTQDVKTVVEDGKRLGGKESAKAHQKGYEETMDDLLGTGATVLTLADNPYPPEDIPSCVSGAVRDLEDCAFSEADGYGYEPVSARANAKFDEVGLIDPKPVMCKDGTCPAVIGNVIVYRNGAHITASYMETLTDWLDGQLPRVT